METTWAEQYVDRAVERCWLDLRIDLGDRLAAAAASGEEVSISFENGHGESLDVDLFDGLVVINCGDLPEVFESADEAAHRVYEILHAEWAMIHPAFLAAELGDAPVEPRGDAVVVVPTLGKAATREQLQAWVEQTFRAGQDEPLAVADNGELPWNGPNGARVLVSVRNQYFIEIWTVLAERVGFGRAHKLIDQLTRRHPAVRFHLHQDTLIMSRVLDASPFVPEHLTDALSLHLELAGDLGWVREKALRKRARLDQEAEAVPTQLAALLPTAYRVSMACLVEVVAQTAGDPQTLAAWLEAAKRARRAARDLPRADDDTNHVGQRARWAWLRLERALTQATTTRPKV